MIRHSVIFSLKHAVGSAEETAFESGGAKLVHGSGGIVLLRAA